MKRNVNHQKESITLILPYNALIFIISNLVLPAVGVTLWLFVIGLR